jgi:hypothetical protein
MKRLAQVISILLGPFVWPITLIVIIFRSGLSTQQITVLLPIVLLLQVGIPYFYIFRAYKLKKISDLDITKREERYKTMIITCISFVSSLLFIHFFGNSLLLKLSIMTLMILVINTIITFSWKISLHMTLNVISALIINYLYHWQLPFLYLSIPLIFWSRLYLKKHTIMQLIGGLVINGAIALFFIFFVF